MKIKQFDTTNMLEGFVPMGGYYVWTVHFADGTTENAEITNDDISDEDIAKHFGKEVTSVDRNHKVRMRGQAGGNDAWHREQDRAEQRRVKDLLGTGQLYEGGMGGINRCAPSTDVSYEKVLNDVTDKWKGQTTIVKELSIDKMTAYKDAANSEQSFRKRPLRKLAKTVQGVSTANRKIDAKFDRRQGPQESTYESRLQEFVNEAPNDNSFSKILGKQHADAQSAKPKPKVVELDFHGWTIKYRPAASPHDKVQWMIVDKKSDIKNKGESTTDKDAVRDAEEWITSGGGTKKEASKTVNIDFNSAWTKAFAEEGQPYYVTFDINNNIPYLIMSTEPQKGLKKTDIRRGNDQHVTLTPNESNKIGLQPNGRYLLGPKEEFDPETNTVMFPLIFQGIVQSSSERQRMGAPGITVAHSRD